MSNARNLANLLGTDTQIQTADIADGVFQANKSLIINGACTISQRGTSQTGITSGGYKQAPDRFQFNVQTAGTWTASQSTTAPEGFSNSYKVECTTADASLAAGDVIRIRQRIEGQNLQQLKKGTSNAESVTLSFYVRSSKTGTYIVELTDKDNSRHIAKSYSITTADTWQYVSVTYDGDTTGSLDNNNGESLTVQFWLAAGSNFQSGTLATVWASQTAANRAVGQVNLADTVGNDWYITGVSLEIGETATPFEHRSFADELRRCQRYYVKQESVYGGYHTFGFGTWFSATRFISYVQMPVPMRTTPSLAVSGKVEAWQGTAPRGIIAATTNIASVGGNGSPTIIELDVTSGLSGGSAGSHGFLKANNDSSALLEFNAEL